MNPLVLRQILIAAFVIASLSPLRSAARAEEPKPKGQRIFICGHSFHVPIAAPLQEVAELARITDQRLLGTQFLGGSMVSKHWNLPDDRDQARKAVRTGDVDVLTLSPKGIFPDEGIDKFTELALEFNSDVRVFVQESWASFDSPTGRGKQRFANEDRDSANVDDLRQSHAPFFKQLADQIRGLNDRLKTGQKQQVVYLVPAGRAVLTLRDKVVQGKVPGIVRQSELFRDATGHGKGAVTLLSTYCYYATIYGRSPVGLPIPAALKGQVNEQHEEKLNQLLQEVAWEAVTNEPLAGVKN
jgi:hypothetical protein